VCWPLLLTAFLPRLPSFRGCRATYPPSAPSMAGEPLRRQQHSSLQQAHAVLVDRYAGRARLYDQWKQLLESFEGTYGNNAHICTRSARTRTRPPAREDSDSSSDEGETTWTLSDGHVKPKPMPTVESEDSPSDIMSLEHNSRSVAVPTAHTIPFEPTCRYVAGAGPARGWFESRAATAPTTSIISTQSLSGALSATLLEVRQTRGQWEGPAEMTPEKTRVAFRQEGDAAMKEAAMEEAAAKQSAIEAVQVGALSGYEDDAASSDADGADTESGASWAAQRLLPTVCPSKRPCPHACPSPCSSRPRTL